MKNRAIATILISSLILLPTSSFAKNEEAKAEKSEEDVELVDLSLEELMDTQVYSASKRPEKLSEIPAAAYVLSSEDIARSGVTSIPEALRLVPGVQVARSNSHTWAISIRGFNRQFSNKLLVMIDGRTVYTPLFSGVFWDVQDYVLEDIDRIEVIRGPGGTLWGANAVNGVINIITKEARKTQGVLTTATVGTHNDIVEVRKGGIIGDSNFYRMYGKYKHMSEFKDSAAARSANDDWEQGRAGFRYDFRDWSYNPVTLQGDIYSGKREGLMQIPTGVAPFVSEVDFGEQHRGGNLMLKWKTPLSDEVDGEFGAYMDYIYRDSDNLVQQERITYNFDFQANYEEGAHSLIGGTEVRFIDDNLDSTSLLSYAPESSSVNITSVFLQDKIALLKDELYFTIGSKLDYNDYTGFEFQPNARLLWQVTDNQSLWAAVSRAVRTPSRGEDSFSRFAVGGFPFGTAFIIGNTDYESENLIAYELGYRGDLSSDVFLDVTAFYNDYSDLRSTEVSSIVGPTTFLTSRNNGYGESYGLEVASVIGVTEKFDMKLSSTFLKQTFHLQPGSTDTALQRDEDRSPSWQHAVNTTYKISDDLTLNNNFIYVSDIEYYSTSVGTTTRRNIHDYLRVDAKLSWQIEDDLELNVVGQNLFDSNHQEFDEIIYSTASEVPRMAYVQLKYKF